MLLDWNSLVCLSVRLFPIDVDIKAATKAFGKKFSSGASAEKNAENLMEITVQGEIMQDLGHLCNELYDVRCCCPL